MLKVNSVLSIGVVSGIMIMVSRVSMISGVLRFWWIIFRVWWVLKLVMGWVFMGGFFC